MLAGQLDARDSISMVVYAGASGVVLPPGDYDWVYNGWDIASNPSAPLSVSSRIELGGFYDGTKYGGNVTVQKLTLFQVMGVPAPDDLRSGVLEIREVTQPDVPAVLTLVAQVLGELALRDSQPAARRDDARRRARHRRPRRSGRTRRPPRARRCRLRARRKGAASPRP